MQDDAIDTLRSQVNAVDRQLLTSINERASLAFKIGKAKAALGKDVYDPERERAVLARLVELNEGPLDKGAIEEVFAQIITICREIQSR